MASTDEAFFVQNAANAASTIVAAIIARSETPRPVSEVLEAFHTVRESIFSATVALCPPTERPAPQRGEGGSPKTCPHGERALRNGTKKDGTTWKAWMCALPQDSDLPRCKPIDAVTGQAWK